MICGMYKCTLHATTHVSYIIIGTAHTRCVHVHIRVHIAYLHVLQ